MTVATDLMVIGTVHDYGDQALLLQFDSTAEVLAWTDALREADLLGVLDIVPGVAHRADQARRAALSGPDPATAGQAAPRSRGGGGRRPHPIDGRADVVIDVDLRRRRPRRGGPADRAGPRRKSLPRIPTRRGGSDSADSHRVSPTSSAAIRGSTFRGDPSRGPRCPAGSVGAGRRIQRRLSRGSRPAAGS